DVRHAPTIRPEESTTRAEPGEAGYYTDQVDHVLVEGHDTLKTAAGVPLWWLDDQPGAVLVRRGKGRVLVVAEPSLLTERGLHRADNKIFLHDVVAYHVPRGGRVFFDEYHHGLHSGGGFSGYLRYHQQGWTLWPLLFVVGMAVWALAIRLGPAVKT